MQQTNPLLDPIFAKPGPWQLLMNKLREILLSCGLQEERKWYQPVYTWQGKNIAIIGSFKSHMVLSFFKGSLLKDPQGLLQFAGANSQAAKLFRFTRMEEVTQWEELIKTYVTEAIALEKAGVKVAFKKISEHPLPEELQQKFKEVPDLQKAFESLTPGRQRAYLLHFSGAKQAATRRARIEKYIPRMLSGKGIHDE